MPTDTAADISSADSLSFAGLVCIQEQYSKSQQHHVLPPLNKKNATKIQNQGPEFEFSIAVSPNNNPSANVLLSGVHSLPQAIPSQSNQSQVVGQISIKDILQPRTSGRRSTRNETAHSGSAKKTNTEVRKKANKEQRSENKSFGQKFIQSMVTPCRTCRAIEPSQSKKEAHIVQRDMKLQ